MTVGFVAPTGDVVSEGDTVWRDSVTGYVFTEPAPGRQKAVVTEAPPEIIGLPVDSLAKAQRAVEGAIKRRDSSVVILQLAEPTSGSGEAKFQIGDVVYHKASGERGVVTDIATICTVHSGLSAAHLGSSRDDCEFVFDGTYDLSVGLGKVAEGVHENVLELGCKIGESDGTASL